jgi:hypothetical protein
MKRLSLIGLIILATACTAGTLQAQSHEVRVQVPFDFIVGAKQLPSGNYTFVSESNGVVEIDNRAQNIAILSVTQQADAAGHSSKLVFNKYGDHYFLSEILCPSIAMDMEIPKSKLEKQIRTQQAWLGPQQVLVSAM